MNSVGSLERPATRRSPVLDIVIAHDSEIFRIGLRAVLKDRSGLRVSGEASTAAETLKKVKKLQPDILLLRLGLPDKSALEIFPELLKLRKGLKILLFAAEGPTMNARYAVLTPTVARRAVEEGALGLVLKPDAHDIRLALDALSKNKAFISPNIFEGISSELTRRTERLPSVGDLTRREADVFKEMAIGRTTKEIAFDLRNSPRTIEVHRANIMRKLGFHSQADLILFALQHQAVALPQATRAAVTRNNPLRNYLRASTD